MQNVGLILQGGGMRGVYTSGVLDFFMENQLFFPYVVAVSAGACNAAAYLSRQPGFGRRMYLDHLQSSKSVSLMRWFTKKSVFHMDFIFEEIPTKIDPLDFDTLFNAKEQLWVGTTDCETGKSLFFNHRQCKQIFQVVKASCSLPIITPIVEYEGRKLLDGGIAEPIPIEKSLIDGNEFHVIVLTSQFEYLKRPLINRWFLSFFYAQYPELVQALIDHHEKFLKNIKRIQQLEQQQKAFIIRPSVHISLSSIHNQRQKLTSLYEMGYHDAKQQFSQLANWLHDQMPVSTFH
ncbi:patatin family protein [Hazenella sp. IB182357]|uniref:Patatin family protein n=1 Tax=Polycladospora coralii TaxID=2771432 RepID=A0A926RTU1_9BACL|nr:patatin family protein [Polycladospora coralii]MBD1371762.1 patatin family protein [Polycladospora coralii]MBS7529223.1 patatin family protein [Polycladospora coralii]